MEFETSQILIALATYFVATASPGPATLAIMDIAMDKGRKPAVIFASGVLAGSFIWALLALLGIAILLSTYANLLYWLKIGGGVYLLWLSYKSIKKITSKEANVKRTSLSNKKLFRVSSVSWCTQRRIIVENPMCQIFLPPLHQNG